METKTELDYLKIDNIQWEDIDWSDYPDFCDAFVVSADYDGEPMTDEQIDGLDKDWLYDKLIDKLF